MVQDCICQVELRFSSCACVYSQEKMCPVHLYHWVYLMDIKISCAKIYFLLPAKNYKAQSGLAYQNRNLYWIIAPSG